MEKNVTMLLKTQLQRKHMTKIWNGQTFISEIKHDVHSCPTVVYKLIKHPNEDEKVNESFSIINKEIVYNVTSNYRVLTQFIWGIIYI